MYKLFSCTALETREIHVIGLKIAYLGPISKIAPHSPVFGPKPKLICPNSSPLGVVLVMVPNSNSAKIMCVTISGYIEIHALKGVKKAFYVPRNEIKAKKIFVINLFSNYSKG